MPHDPPGGPPPEMPASRFPARLPRRLRKLLYRNYFRRDRYRRYDRLGLMLWLNYANYVDRQLIIHEPYEAPQLHYLLEQSARRPFDLFIDVGANFGLYSLLLARTGRAGDILAFEPDPRNYLQLVTNIAANGLAAQIRSFACGLSERDTTAGFLQAHRRSTGMSRIEATAPAGTRLANYTDSRVPVIRFDGHFCCRARRVLVKIDVEGHESEVIAGMSRLLRDNDCLVQAEVFDTGVEQFDAILGELGYRKVTAFGHDRLYRKP
jgi:FkbM family methyltransferase